MVVKENHLVKTSEMMALSSALSELLLEGTKTDRKLIETKYANLEAAVKNIPPIFKVDYSKWNTTLKHYKELLDKDATKRRIAEMKIMFESFKNACHKTKDLLRSLAVASVLPLIDWDLINKKMFAIQMLKIEMKQFYGVEDKIVSFLDINAEHTFLLYYQLKKRESGETKLKLITYTF